MEDSAILVDPPVSIPYLYLAKLNMVCQPDKSLIILTLTTACLGELEKLDQLAIICQVTGISEIQLEILPYP